MIEVEDRVEIMNHNGSRWQWSKTFGIVKKIDKYCYTVETENGQTIRDVFTHFRKLNN